jgi:ribosomal-protein-alanine N-acetyltransferase
VGHGAQRAELNGRRLVLRPAVADDLTALLAVWNEREVRRFLFDDQVVTKERGERLLAASTTGFADHGYGLWLAYEREAGVLVGFAGLMKAEGAPPSLVVGIVPGRWRVGLATESAALVIEHGFRLGLPEIRADADEPNVASVRLLGRLGFELERRTAGHERPLLYYRLAKESPGRPTGV